MKRYQLYITAFLLCFSTPVLADNDVGHKSGTPYKAADPRVQEYLDRSVVYLDCKKTVDTPDFATSLCRMAIAGVIDGSHIIGGYLPSEGVCSQETVKFIKNEQKRFCLKPEGSPKIETAAELNDALMVIAKRYIRLIESMTYNNWSEQAFDNKEIQFNLWIFPNQISTVSACRLFE